MDSAKRPNSCLLFILPLPSLPFEPHQLQALPLPFLGPMVRSFVTVRKPHSWEKAGAFERRLEAEYHVNRNAEHEGVAPQPGHLHRFRSKCSSLLSNEFDSLQESSNKILSARKNMNYIPRAL